MNSRTVMVAEPGHPTPPRGERALALVDHLRGRIEGGLARPGARLPSVRQLADDWGVSRFTAVEAYDRLVAAGWVEARRGSGFFARFPETAASTSPAKPDTYPNGPNPSWLLKAMLRTCQVEKSPGAGMVPANWLDEGIVSRALRAAAREGGTSLGAGHPLGHPALREALSRKLGDIGIAALPSCILTANGASGALDVIIRTLVMPGDTVLVDDPGFFMHFAQFAARGARVVGVPRLGDGPDLPFLEAALLQHRPRLYVTTASVHNPTGGHMSPAKAFQVLKLTENAGTHVVEDDVFGDFALHPPPRLAALGGTGRVLHVGSFSKTLAPGWRVGYLAGSPDLMPLLVEQKLLSGITSPQPTEAAIATILADGAYRRHVSRLRDRAAHARARALTALVRAGFTPADPAGEGMFIWARGARDGEALAADLWEEGILAAPGALFSPSGAKSTWTRINVAAAEHEPLMAALARANRRKTR